MPGSPAQRIRSSLAVCFACLGLFAALAGCGGTGGTSGASSSGRRGASSGTREPATARTATVVLDFTPNAVHAGLFAALARGYDRQQGIRLRIEQPSGSTDGLKALTSGQADFAVLDIHDLAIARQDGRDIVAVMALVQRPLAALLAQPSVTTPRGLEGQRVGVTGLPSDTAVLRSIVAGAGGDPNRVQQVTIGFDAVPALLTGRVAGATAFWDVEGIELSQRRAGIHEFRVDDYGAPSYPELLLCVPGSTIRHDPDYVRRTLAAIVGGYDFTLAHPAASVADELSQAPGTSRAALSAQMRVLLGAFRLGGGPVGALDPARLRAWAAWELRFGIVRSPIDVRGAFDGQLLPAR